MQWGKSSVTKNLITRMNNMNHTNESHEWTKSSTESEKWRHARNLVEIAWMNKKQIWNDCDVIWS